MKRSVFKCVLVGLSAATLLLGTSGVHANGETCTRENWSAKVGDTNLNADEPGPNNRRYAGRCGLRVTLDNSEAYLTDESPLDETVFNVRFYFFLNAVTEDVTLFQAEDGNTDPVITATYDASENDVSVVFANAGTPQTVVAQDVSTGWNSLEIQWEASPAAQPKVVLGTADPVTASATIDTSNIAIDGAKLGAIGTVPASGSIDFDDYDSRRDTVPGRLCRGLTDQSRSALNLEDVLAIFNDFATGGSLAANGVPDYDGSGAVDLLDVVDVFTRFATGQNDCDANR